ncbi:hypothetical protein VTO42DRAFT_2361 [Malbranchea cinnamomea]
MTSNRRDAVGHQQAADARVDPRDGSPSPSLCPTPAISSCPSPDRTFSTVSSVSNFSGYASSSVSASSKRRGFIRPQGTVFAESARNRESVMSLGSITHLQYYFARTGLLDGKGAQLARSKKQQEQDVPKLTLTPQTQFGGELTESPVEEIADGEEWDGEPMLPPTVSTYNVPTYQVPPPPDLEELRRDLREALEQARQVLLMTGEELAAQARQSKSKDAAAPAPSPTSDDASRPAESSTTTTTAAEIPQGWHEIQGVRTIDVVTHAIRSAKVFYTSHEHPERLATIKSDRKIREELLGVLDVLKRYATRNFTGGLRDDERDTIDTWISNGFHMMEEDCRLEAVEKHKRASWAWTNGDWLGKEREREFAFLQSLETTGNPLPPWTAPDGKNVPTAFLKRLQDGRDLVRFHNEAVRLSRRHFGQIKSYHQDIGKPYRLAENLRFWAKAAEIRWETLLDVDVMRIVYGDSADAWLKFDDALLRWCKAVREELLRDWKEEEEKQKSSLVPPPEGEV